MKDVNLATFDSILIIMIFLIKKLLSWKPTSSNYPFLVFCTQQPPPRHLTPLSIHLSHLASIGYQQRSRIVSLYEITFFHLLPSNAKSRMLLWKFHILSTVEDEKRCDVYIFAPDKKKDGCRTSTPAYSPWLPPLQYRPNTQPAITTGSKTNGRDWEET